MRQHDKLLVKEIFRECSDAMRIPLTLHIIGNLLTGILNVVTAGILGEFADAAFALNLSLGLENAAILAACIIATVFVVPLFGLVGNFSMLKHALLHDNRVVGRYFDKDPQKAISVDAGALQYELEDAPNMLRIYWVNILSQVVTLPISWAYLLYSAGSISWALTGVMISISLIKLITPMLLSRKLGKLDEKVQTYNAMRRAYETEITRKPYIVKLWGLQIPFLDRINQLYRDYHVETESTHIIYQAFADHMPKFMNRVSLLLLFITGAAMMASGSVSPGDFTAMIGYLTITQTLMANIGEIIQNYPLMMNAAKRMCHIYSDPESDSGEQIEHFNELRGNKVSYSFTDKEVFNNRNFAIINGQKVRIAGENGSGKSTLAKIICAILLNYGGTISINDMDFRSLNAKKWRKKVAYAQQDPYLFNATVRENIVMGDPLATNEEADALMSEFGIRHLADRVISMGVGLSGGEKQKISIARALIKKSELLILDEPTNYLDQESISALKKNIKETDKTVILISHDEYLDDTIEVFYY